MASATVREDVGRRLQERVLQKTPGLDLAAFEHQAYYDQLNRAMSGADFRGPQLLERALDVVRLVPTLLGYAVALAALTPILLLIVFGTIVLTVAVSMLGGQDVWDLLREQTRERRLSEYYAGLLSDRALAKEVRLYGLADHLLEKWESLFWQTRNDQRRLALRASLRETATIILSVGAVFLGMWWAVAMQPSDATAGEYALLFQSLTGLFNGMFALAYALKHLGEQSGYASDFRAFFQLPGPLVQSPAPPRPAPGPGGANPDAPPAPRPFPRPLRQGIRFEDVYFTYPGRDRPTLASVSFTIRAGEKVALVGENGAGKTTLVKLLLGLFRPDAGRITFDGCDVREIDPLSLFRAMSAVLQGFVRYQLTFRENVGLGQPDRVEDEDRLAEAAAKAGAHEIVERLAQRYETLLGPDVGGVDLSGGQWQKIALARGFFREAEVLVLDEPTAALDPLAELAVFERFVTLAEGRTAILISHRLGMARLADRVLVLEHGRLVEEGPHEALISAGGAYAALFGAQARWYA